jgi:hypothetical protein
MVELVERIVREVMSQLAAKAGEAAHAAPCDSKPAAVVPPPQPQQHLPDAKELVLASRLVTMSDLDGRLESIRRLVVPAGAIVTPAVRDELQRCNVALSHASRRTDKGASATTDGLRLLAIVHAGACDAAALGPSLGSVPAAVEVSTDDCVIALSDRLAAVVREGRALGVVLTKYSAAALCVANRLPQVRAVSGSDPARLAGDVAGVGANVLVIDPQAVGMFRTRRLIGEFCRGGVRRCPRALGSRLN